MNDDIIRMAREANCGWAHNGTEPVLTGETQLERFAALVAAAEREACAEVCEQWNASHPEALAAAIRARGTRAEPPFIDPRGSLGEPIV